MTKKQFLEVKWVKGVIVLEVVLDMFDGFLVFSLGRVVLYTVFMFFPLPQNLVKTLAQNLIKLRVGKPQSGSGTVVLFLREHVENYRKKFEHKFSTSNFLICASWMPESANFDRKFRIYKKFPPENWLERSRIWVLGPKMIKLMI